jgi:hypothetical protein
MIGVRERSIVNMNETSVFIKCREFLSSLAIIELWEFINFVVVPLLLFSLYCDMSAESRNGGAGADVRR